MERINNDLKILTLAKLLAEACEVAKGIDGFSYCFVNANGADINIDNQTGKASNLCFVLSEHSWEKNTAKCEVSNNVTVKFPVTEKTKLAVLVEEVTKPITELQDKAA